MIKLKKSVWISILLITAFAFLIVVLFGKTGETKVKIVRLPAKKIPTAPILPLNVPSTDTIQPGCGDFRLLVNLTSNSTDAAAQATGPANATAVVWNYQGPKLAPLPEDEGTARVFNDDNRGLFGLTENIDKQEITASHLLLVSGIKAGQSLTLEAGHNPTATSVWRIYDASADPNDHSRLLATLSLSGQQETGNISIDLCSTAKPVSLVPTKKQTDKKALAFYYPWWSSSKKAFDDYDCRGDQFAWVRENTDGKTIFVTAHTPIFKDQDWTIYKNTQCWEKRTDDWGRTGWVHDVYDTGFLAEQMRLAQAAGLDGFAFSVHGDNSQEMKFLQQRALPTAEENDFSIAALYEAPETLEESGWSGDDEKEIQLVGDHLREIVSILAESSASLRLNKNNQSVVVFVDPALLARFASPQAWQKIHQIIQKANAPYVLFSGPGSFTQVFTSKAFTGVYHDLDVVETAEKPLNLPAYTLRPERRLAYKMSRLWARQKNMRFILPVVLGWESPLADPNNPDDTQLTRDYGSGKVGEYYRVRWEDALEQDPDWIVITSWNEWAEGTELEPSEQFPPSKYSFLYATKKYIDCFKRHRCDF